MSNQQLLFIADTAFIDHSITQQYALLPVFPRESGDGAYRASLDELLRWSKLQSAYFDELLPKLLPVFKKYMPAAGDEVQHLIRPFLYTVTSYFVDRCIRVLHRIQQQQGKDIAVVKVEPIDGFQSLHEINHQTWHLNQDIIQRIMTALGYEKVHVFEKKDYPEYPNLHVVPNLIFLPQRSGLSGILTKLLNRAGRILDQIHNPRGKFYSISLDMDRYYLLKRGLLGPFGFFQKLLKIKLKSSRKDLKFRENLFAETERILRPQFELFLSKKNLNLQKMELNQLSQAYVQLFIDWFPIGFLEGLPSNLEQVRHNLNMNKVIGIVGHSMTSHVGYLLSTVTRLAGKTVVGIQHGGHLGYIEDNSNIGYAEYALYDKIITWGWTRIDDHLPHCKTIPLPGPKLSEQPLKANYLKNAKSKSTDIRDILFLSNALHRFPLASTCGQSRPDYIDEIINSQEDLMRAIRDAGMTISHKPFNMRFVDLYPEHFHRLEVAGGSNSYRLLKSKHKGLTVKLIKTCRIVLYDQIGTGTLECFTSEVPTMVYWKRIWSRETPWAKDLVSALEQYGVVHSDADSLAKEIKTYLADPEEWMNNPRRKQAIQNFCKSFALTSNDWPKLWRDYLSSLR